MNLKEHQAKKILQELGFGVPAGVLCDAADMAEVLGATLDTQRWVVKAQILSGGRARGYFRDDPQSRGGIRFANSAAQLVSHCRQMLGGTLVTEQTGKSGERVASVYLEDRCDVIAEHYLALTTNPRLGELAFIVSESGGSDIESLAQQQPDSVYQFRVPLDQPFTEGEALVDKLGLAGEQRAALLQCLHRMIDSFVEKDMLLIEINPLAVSAGGELVALDASIVFDDNALFRQGHEEQMDAYTHLPEQEYNAAVQGLNLVKLEGNIATLSAGAGLAMATIDAICEYGGTPANFLDVPPSAAVSRLQGAITLLLRDPGTACLLVNVFGGGIMRCDAVADALLLANRATPFHIPVVVRLAGTNAELGRQRLRDSLPDVRLAEDLADAARMCCDFAASQPAAPRQDSGGKLWRKLRGLMPEKET